MRVRGCCPACDTHADRLLTWRVPWRRYRTSIHRGGFIPRAVLIWRGGVYDVVEHLLRAYSVGPGSIAWLKQGVRLRGMATCYDHVCDVARPPPIDPFWLAECSSCVGSFSAPPCPQCMIRGCMDISWPRTFHRYRSGSVGLSYTQSVKLGAERTLSAGG